MYDQQTFKYLLLYFLLLSFIIAGNLLHPALTKRGARLGELSVEGFRECRKSSRSLKLG
jgi:hypothetical protein